MHFVVPFIPPEIMGLFQATVLNYTEKLQEWFSIGIGQRVPLGMMALTYDFDPSEFSLSNPKVRRKLTSDVAKWLGDFQSDIKQRSELLGNEGNRFAIPIEFTLALVKNPNRADIVLSRGEKGVPGLIVETTKDVERTHPYFQRNVVDQVNAKLSIQDIAINGHDILAIRRACGISDRGEFVWKSDRTRFSESFINWLVKQATDNPEVFVNARTANRNERRTNHEAQARQRNQE